MTTKGEKNKKTKESQRGKRKPKNSADQKKRIIDFAQTFSKTRINPASKTLKKLMTLKAVPHELKKTAPSQRMRHAMFHNAAAALQPIMPFLLSFLLCFTV